jgi:hypothetical protein
VYYKTIIQFSSVLYYLCAELGTTRPVRHSTIIIIIIILKNTLKYSYFFCSLMILSTIETVQYVINLLLSVFALKTRICF